ncbi:MAG: hypothetical protein LBG80_12990 [Bacteroidales bacterium]|jgi:uncharacterized protein with PIN domain|nr:hypothetical protein [Bacteroidales bacterium]
MNTKDGDFDLKQILHLCTKCNEYMQFHTTEECESDRGILHFVVYLCEKCDETIWILDRDNQYMKDLSEYINAKGI